MKQIRLLCQSEAKNTRPGGAIAFSAFSVVQAVPDQVRPPSEPMRDEVWLLSGDQLFGEILRADGRSVEIQGRYGRRSLPWSEVRGCYLRQANAAVPGLKGAVRLSLHSGLSTHADLLDGVLLGLDAQRLRLRHALLGELSLERSRVKLLRPR